MSSDPSGRVLPTCRDNNFSDQFVFKRKNFRITTRDQFPELIFKSTSRIESLTTTFSLICEVQICFDESSQDFFKLVRSKFVTHCSNDYFSSFHASCIFFLCFATYFLIPWWNSFLSIWLLIIFRAHVLCKQIVITISQNC